MNNIKNLSKFYYWGGLLFHTKISSQKSNAILSLCKKEENINHLLAGHINEEYKIDKDIFFELIKENLSDYINMGKQFYNKQIASSVKITEAWVNFMKDGEFNPPHTHNADLSCVLYLKIPEELKKENQQYTGTDYGAGSVCFSYGEKKPLNINTVNIFPEENDFFIFPANMTHYVYPFRSKVERISVSANYYLVK
jgi:uncharacterized protein (TIGR02466 family)